MCPCKTLSKNCARTTCLMEILLSCDQEARSSSCLWSQSHIKLMTELLLDFVSCVSVPARTDEQPEADGGQKGAAHAARSDPGDK